MVLAMMSKTLSCGGQASLYIMSAEQFPSAVRGGTISLLSAAGKATGMLTPFVAHLVLIRVLSKFNFAQQTKLT